MKNFVTYSILVLAACMVLFFTGCDNDTGENSNIYDMYYKGDFRDNRNGSVEVANNTVHDMLLFSGSVLSTNYIVGGVRASSTNTVNFSTETDYTAGGYKVLQAVKQSEFDVHKEASAVDWKALVTYGEGRRFRANIVSTNDGDYQYRVSNRSNSYFLELRKDSPDGEKVVFLDRGEINKVVRCADSNVLTLYPVWLTYNNVTRSVVTFTPAGFQYQDVQPRLLADAVYYFPATGDIVFPDF